MTNKCLTCEHKVLHDKVHIAYVKAVAYIEKLQERIIELESGKR